MPDSELPADTDANPVDLLRLRVAAAEDEVARQRARLAATMRAMEESEKQPDLLGRFFR